ncbi:NAD(P)-binding Rossmann-fold superfamily protein [Klebsormidium nitens]|uniref:NAD(P)-binding Rossmann-fold superfamily protein n=1 Tax=Klebsormidium nitens TaxID=105231 RepID=A0A1Y1HPM8_KLENI|nr:NAD(P)-binding Rossmann-fold superfamily protein [Klebsormidium nitens]|eukprot:GAQ78931.1 NAD(P)-binding Rossmann-fold superfamily protein [Klebsormidium nitens]
MAPPAPYAAVHATPNGPGDARPTAMAIIKDEGLVGKLKDKVILITGCSSGIGVETARALHATGAHLFLTVRNVGKGEKVVQDIVETDKSGSGGKVELLRLELDSLASVRAAAAEFLSRSKKLNVLINNAGIMACPEGQTQDGFETQFGTNHLGHFLLFQLLKPLLLTSSTPEFQSRVVSLSSTGHGFSGIHFDDLDLKKAGYQKWVAYGQAKTANIYLATEIERRYGAQGLHATAAHPGGIISTGLARHMEPEEVDSFLSPEWQKKMKDVEQGAATTVWAAVGKEWEGKGGKYLENVSESAKPKDEADPFSDGYAKHAYDAEAAKKLWAVSLELVGMEDDDNV